MLENHESMVIKYCVFSLFFLSLRKSNCLFYCFYSDRFSYHRDKSGRFHYMTGVEGSTVYEFNLDIQKRVQEHLKTSSKKKEEKSSDSVRNIFTAPLHRTRTHPLTS